jgi:uncharacterized membrane protein YhaH (DUF805 family)
MKMSLKNIFNNFIYCMTDGYNYFSGRSSRSEYWSFVVTSVIIFSVISYPITFFNIDIVLLETNILKFFLLKENISILDLLYLYVLYPLLSATFRRLHDTQKSGIHVIFNHALMCVTASMLLFLPSDWESIERWGVLYFIIGTVYLIHTIFFLYLLLSKGQQTDNLFGPPRN